MKNLIFQLKQLFMPFPEVDSWAYNRQVERYDREMAKKPPGLKKDLETISESVKKIADAQREMLKATHTIQLCLCRLSEKENPDESSDSNPYVGVDWAHGPDNTVLDWSVINPFVGPKPFIPGFDTTADPSGNVDESGDSGTPE